MRRRLLAAALALVVALMTMRLISGTRRTIYVGGPVLTMNARNEIVEALGVAGDRIGAVGTDGDVRAWGGRTARVIDLRGRALLPGFIDAHGHFPGAGIFAVHADLNSPPIGSVGSIDDLVARLREQAADAEADAWVGGFGYDDTLLAERRHPTRADLDRASATHPIAAVHVSGHLAAVNSAALARLGFTRDTPDPEGGRIARDATGEPTGLLEETAADPARDRLLALSALDRLRVVRAASAIYARTGVTTAQSGLATLEQMRGLTWASRFGFVGPRLVLWPDPDTVESLASGAAHFEPYDTEWVRTGAVKLMADGSIQGYTAYLREPYHVPPSDDPTYRGYPRLEHDELEGLVGDYHALGWQVAVHGNGDAAIDDILDAIDAAQQAHPRADARHVVVHAQMATAEQLNRMRRLGVIPSFFVLHTYYWGDRHRDVFLGPERAARISPARSAAVRGMRFTLHCDTPVVPMEPLRLVWAAVNRRTSGGATLGADERLEPLRALRAVTIDAAYQHFEEDLKGSLEEGKLADLVILARSPLEDPERLDQIEVVETIVGGRTVFRR